VELRKALVQLQESKIIVEGACSHFADSDNPDY
jgi:hypothetical protein